MHVQVIVISGSMGSGKTTVLGEASILSASGVVHAAIDLDAVASALLPDAVSTDLVYLNPASVWTNFATAGVTGQTRSGGLRPRGPPTRLWRALPVMRLAETGTKFSFQAA
jgi:hypothetical protein